MTKKSNNTDTKNIDSFLAPSAYSVAPNHLQVGNQYARTILLATYPRYLHTNWFSPVINLDRVFDISIYVNPKNTAQVLRQLRDQLARLEAEVMEETSSGKVRNPILETAIQDIESLRDRLQQGTDRFFELGVYITFYENSLRELDEAENKIKGMLEYQLIFSRPATFRMSEGFLSTLPLNSDKLAVYTSLNTEPLSSIFPFVSFDLTSNSGILYGINTHNNSLVLYDRFGLENANAVVFGKSGGGKSIDKKEHILCNINNEIRLAPVGKLVDGLIAKFGATHIDNELEGVFLPNVKIWAFNENLKGSWSTVTVAARKKAPHDFYKFTTRSGRQITTTGDHNMVTIKNGLVVDTKSSEVKTGDSIPLPRYIEMPDVSIRQLNLLELLAKSNRVYVSNAQEIIKKYYPKLKGGAISTIFGQKLDKYLNGSAIPISHFSKIIRALKIATSDQSLQSLQITSIIKKLSLPIILSVDEELMRLIGYIVAEGNVNDGAICITNYDSEIAEDIKKSYKKHGISFFTSYKSIRVGSRVFIEIARALKLNKKSGYKRVPSFVFNVGKNEIAAFIKAYFEGDGTVAHNSIYAVSKSKKLASDLCYLLYYFGIIARISKTKKKAPNWKHKKTYWKLVVSGHNDLKKFRDDIGFISKRKSDLLSTITAKPANTNVDVIPGLAPVFKRIYELISPRFFNIQEINAIKRGVYNPSPAKLKETLDKIRDKIADLRGYEAGNKLFGLPDLGAIIERGKTDKELNQKLWAELGASWQLMKNRAVAPKTQNVLRLIRTIQPDFSVSLQDLKKDIYTGFQVLSLPVKHYNRALQSALIDRPNSNTSYGLISDSRRYLLENYRKKLKNLLELEQLLSRLETLAQADLFWDPIEKIEKIENHKEKYVYDLTVDNEVFLAGTGGLFVHNSYTIKLEILRSLIFGTQVLVIDPEDEYKFLAETVGGSNIKISINSPHHINALDLPMPKTDEAPADVFKSHLLDLMGLLKLILGELTPEESSILDEALIQTYAIKDITPEVDFSNAAPPILSDLQSILEGLTGAESMAIRLKKYTQGTFAGFLNNPTNVSMDNRLVVFSIRDMEEELRPVAMYLILNHIWTQVRRDLKKRILVVDEAWWLMKYQLGAEFLFNLAKRARKYYLGLTTISQDIPDFMATPQGKAIVTNSSIQILTKQSPAAIEVVKQTFNLTDAEKYYLLEARVGFGLFFVGQNHVGIRVVASYAEDQIITSDPRQILEVEKAKAEWAKETN